MAKLHEVVHDDPLFLGRLVGHIALGIGIPMALYRLEDFPDPPSANMDYHDACRPTHRFFCECQALHETIPTAFNPSGQRFEHPFATLLRNEQYWRYWELGFFKQQAARICSTKILTKIAYPDGLGAKLTAAALWIDDLRGLLVFGPVPSEEAQVDPGFVENPEDTDLAKAINEFRTRIDQLDSEWNDAKWKEIQSGSFSEDSSVKTCRPTDLRSRYISTAHLRRMFVAGGKTVEEVFTESIATAQKALRVALDSEVPDKAEEFKTTAEALEAVEKIALGAVFVTRILEVEKLEFPLGENRIVHLRKNEASFEVSLSNDPVASVRLGRRTKVRVVGPLDANDLSRRLQEYLVWVEDRANRQILEQVALLRQWLSDRFARLKPMFSESKDDSELKDDLTFVAEWLQATFDASYVAFYWLDENGSLAELVRTSRSDDRSRALGLSNSSAIQDIAEQRSNWQNSVIYRAFTNRKLELVSDWDGVVSSRGMWSAHNRSNDASRPRSAVAIPLNAFNRSLGVAEMIGFRPNQFDRLDPYWFGEVTQVISDAFFQSWMLQKLTEANLAALSPPQDGEFPAAKKISNTDLTQLRLNKVCRAIAALFAADGAALWLNNEINPEFEMLGVHGLDLERFATLCKRAGVAAYDWPSISITDTTSGVVRAVRRVHMPAHDAGAAWQDDFVHEQITNPTNITNIREALARVQHDAGLRHIMILPLPAAEPGGGQRAIGALSIYTSGLRKSGEETEYARRWRPITAFVGRHLALIVSALEWQRNRMNQLEQRFYHEVKLMINNVESEFEYLDKIVFGWLRSRPKETIFPGSDTKFGNLVRSADRIGASILDTARMIQTLRTENFEYSISNNEKFSRTSLDEKNTENVYDEIFSCFRLRFAALRFRGMREEIAPVHGKFIIRISNRDIHVIFSNIIDNAIKYGSRGSVIEVELNKRASGSIICIISNRGAELPAAESLRIFNPGQRGKAARETGIEGTGNGLYVVRCIMKELKGSITYYATHISDSEEVMHRFRLTFPAQMVAR